VAESTLAGLRRQRIEKIDRLREIGMNPYPSHSVRTHMSREIVDAFESLEGERVAICGRLMFLRRQGALTFAHLQDESGRIQAVFQRDKSPAESSAENLSYPELKLLDVGDLIEVDGIADKTRRGEISVFANTVRILAKSLRPLPDKHKGLADREASLRRRYLHSLLRSDVQEHFARVAAIPRAIREFLWSRGFIEFSTPVLQTQYGGGTANPFRTQVRALGIDVFLSISHELYLKRLIAAGYEKVFTIGKYFRNEGIDRSHHPEFSMIETMTAFENYQYNMDLVEDLFRHVAVNVFGKTEFTVGDQVVDFEPAWKRVTMRQSVIDETGVDFLDCDAAEANAHLKELQIDVEAPTPGLAMLAAFEARVEPTLIQPTLVHDHPVDISPLAKPSESDPRLAERFEIFIGGMECGDNWTEQNDPQALLDTWRRLKEAGYADPEETHPIDYDFVEVLEYGMPPTTGIGPGLERMAMIFSENRNIDDVIFFPLMRPVLSDVNREIFGGDSGSTTSETPSAISIGVEDVDKFLGRVTVSQKESEARLSPALSFQTDPDTGANQGFGHVAITGLLPERVLIVSGYRVTVEGDLDAETEARKFSKMVKKKLEPLVKRIPGVTEVTIDRTAIEADL